MKEAVMKYVAIGLLAVMPAMASWEWRGRDESRRAHLEARRARVEFAREMRRARVEFAREMRRFREEMRSAGRSWRR